MTIIVNSSKTACVGLGLTIAQIQGIWEGTITNWNQIGTCPAATIVPRARILESGTRPSFLSLARVCATRDNGGPCIAGGVVEETVINNTGLARLQGNAQMDDAIQNNPNHIGYSGLANVSSVGRLKLDCRGNWLNVPTNCVAPFFVDPTDTNAKNGSYPMTRVLHLYTANPPDANTQTYINYMLGLSGQSLVDKAGYVALQPFYPAWEINEAGCVDIGDVSKIGGQWQQKGPEDPNGEIMCQLLRQTLQCRRPTHRCQPLRQRQ